ncbi:hypothetical protein H2203_008645 [Taxawa tesnikishii (nom. ined.)]|nr:hypothetical protein H2203_008645 [Dothideales sp. JES 119]
MTDPSNPRSAAIPAWQRSSVSSPSSEAAPAGPQQSVDGSNAEAVSTQGATPASEAPPAGIEQCVDGSNAEAVSTSEASTESNDVNPVFDLSQVRKFLENPKVKSAPTDKKRAFLESKGVNKEMIDEALGGTLGGTLAGAVEGNSSVSLTAAEFKSSQQRQLQQSQKDVPPIVTYPEFLVKPQKPPPLVTVNRLLNTAYAAGGLAAIVYGFSKYIIKPMEENLTEARHELYQHRQERLDELNEKLSGLVSKVPPAKAKPISQDEEDAADADVESITSDPTELFHRDIGTQTEDLPSSSSPKASSKAEKPTPETTIEKQNTRLKVLISHIEEITAHANKNSTSNEGVKGSLADLKEYLDNMVYNSMSRGDIWSAGPGPEKKDDAIAALKQEIRGVKGVLLSAKRFPAAARGGP